jgi:hypothetical protein
MDILIYGYGYDCDYKEIKSELTFELPSEASSVITEQSNISSEMIYCILQYEYEYELFLESFTCNRFKNSCITTSGNCKITYN